MRARAFVIAAVAMSACSRAPAGGTLVLASTTSVQDSGLFGTLVPAFEAEFPRYRVKVVAVGSGEAIALGRNGDADVMLVHSPEAEAEFMAEGHGILRTPLMRNDFVISGPRGDPAGISDETSAAAAFRVIARANAPFVSRGDDSGTHRRELSIWRDAGIRGRGAWYVETGQGMAETISIAGERAAYLLTDVATFLVAGRSDLEILLRPDPELVNLYSVITPRRARHGEAGRTFAQWLTSPAGRKLIETFGKRSYGRSLFGPVV